MLKKLLCRNGSEASFRTLISKFTPSRMLATSWIKNVAPSKLNTKMYNKRLIKPIETYSVRNRR